MENRAHLFKNCNIESDKPFFTIGAVADILQVHERTLRIYDELKLLMPVRSQKNRRLYSLKDIEKGLFIQYLTKSFGVNLAGVKLIITLMSQNKVPPEKFQSYIEGTITELGIDPSVLEENVKKFSKRGKKKVPSIASV